MATGRQLEGICVVSPDGGKSILIFTCRRRGRVEKEKEEDSVEVAEKGTE